MRVEIGDGATSMLAADAGKRRRTTMTIAAEAQRCDFCARSLMAIKASGVEWDPGMEPAALAWEARVLPLYESRVEGDA